MSAGVSEQRVKGQGNQVNGQKDLPKVKERGHFETAWLPQVQQHQAQQPNYNNALPPEQYYQYQSAAPFQYPTSSPYNMSDRSWANAPEAVTYIGGYMPTPETYSQPNVYNAQFTHPTPPPAYNYYIPQKPFEGYYRTGDQMYGVPINEQIKTIEQDVHALSVSDYRDNNSFQQKKSNNMGICCQTTCQTHDIINLCNKKEVSRYASATYDSW